MPEPSALHYFVGGVPAGAVFLQNLDGLNEILDRIPSTATGRRREYEVCFIGLVSYLEAFWKDHFASLVNICPSLLVNFRKAGGNTTVDAADLVRQQRSSFAGIGFLISERIDFGTAKKVNSAFGALLKISPFSSDEAGSFNEYLNIRNQLVHHGGIVTAQFANQASEPINPEHLFFHSLVLPDGYFEVAATFARDIVRKTVYSTRDQLRRALSERKSDVTDQQQKGTEYLGWRFDEEEDN